MRKNRGFTLIELMIVVSIIGILALIAIPNFQNLRKKAYNASAQTAGRSAKLAEEIYHHENQDLGYMYACELNQLLIHDFNLADDPNVSFLWGYRALTYYTFTTWHLHGDKTFVFND